MAEKNLPHKAKGGKKNRKWQRSPKRSHKKREKYLSTKAREKNKLKRVLQSSGMKAAEEYAVEAGLYSYFKGLL